MMDLNKYIEHTLLKQDATKAEVIKLLEEAKEYNFLGVCVNPVNVKLASESLKGTSIKTVTVIGFPLGQSTTESKVLATIERSDTEQLQITVSEYKGKSYFNLRIYYTTDEGMTWLPTKKGVTFAPEQLDVLEEAIQEAKTLFMEE